MRTRRVILSGLGNGARAAPAEVRVPGRALRPEGPHGGHGPLAAHGPHRATGLLGSEGHVGAAGVGAVHLEKNIYSGRICG